LPPVTHLKVAVAVVGPLMAPKPDPPPRPLPASRYVDPPNALEGAAFPSKAALARELAKRTGRSFDGVRNLLRQHHGDAEAVLRCDPAWKSDPLMRGIGVQN
ncbi:MAG: hypothetical protein JO223_06750, partial [Hyphomicrobiales bacterium]|nr:hypothetical protein [Hyphomicrobiales bacterium]